MQHITHVIHRALAWPCALAPPAPAPCRRCRSQPAVGSLQWPAPKVGQLIQIWRHTVPQEEYDLDQKIDTGKLIDSAGAGRSMFSPGWLTQLNQLWGGKSVRHTLLGGPCWFSSSSFTGSLAWAAGRGRCSDGGCGVA